MYRTRDMWVSYFLIFAFVVYSKSREHQTKNFTIKNGSSDKLKDMQWKSRFPKADMYFFIKTL